MVAEGHASPATDDRYRTYERLWQHRADAKQRTQEQLDGSLLKLSAGALAVSLTPATPLFEARNAGTTYLSCNNSHRASGSR